MRERLIELISQSSMYDLKSQPILIEQIADYLLKNNVVVLPYNVGDDVWYIEELINSDEKYIEHGTIVQVYIADKSITFGVYASGVMYILAESKLYKTFEEAKKALKERSNDKLLYNESKVAEWLNSEVEE